MSQGISFFDETNITFCCADEPTQMSVFEPKENTYKNMVFVKNINKTFAIFEKENASDGF